MKLEEKAYIAGIIDGEGSIMLIKFHKNQFPSPCLSVSSTSYQLLNWIRKTTGLGSIHSKKNYKPDIHQNSYSYTVKYNDALSLIEEIEPYLVIPEKKKRAQMIVKDYKKLTLRNGRYNKEQIKEKQLFYEKFLNIK